MRQEKEIEVDYYLQKLGLSKEDTKVYFELAKSGHSSALQLAKMTAISRTQVYRCLDDLQSHGLVSAEKLSYGTIYRALPIENIEGLLASREADTADLRRNISSMTEHMKSIVGSGGTQATVQHYYGVAGLKQANWNLTKADGEFRVFEAAHISEHLDKAFARRHRERVIERGITTYDLTNATSVTAADLEPVNLSRAFIRHIGPDILKIDFEVFIYNDVVTLLDYTPSQQMAVEIHHPSLNNLMRQLFDAMWATAKPLTIKQ